MTDSTTLNSDTWLSVTQYCQFVVVCLLKINYFWQNNLNSLFKINYNFLDSTWFGVDREVIAVNTRWPSASIIYIYTLNTACERYNFKISEQVAHISNFVYPPRPPPPPGCRSNWNSKTGGNSSSKSWHFSHIVDKANASHSGTNLHAEYEVRILSDNYGLHRACR